jgi:protein-S-isoprenylcysteine O-methyltransferase Ste14
MASTFLAVRTAVFATAFLGFWFWVIGLLRPLSRSWDAAIPEWLAAPGVALVAVGAAGVLTCIAIFVVQGRGTPAPFDPPRRFVARGPYRLVRNPMYSSALMLFVGLGLYWRSIGVLAFAAAWLVLIHAFVVLVEEPGLAIRFGDTYEHYRRLVPRWIPRRGAVA